MQKLYTVEALAELFSKHENTIYTWIEEGLFPHAFKVKGGWYVPEQDLEALMGKTSEGKPGVDPQGKGRRQSGGGFIKGWK